MEIIDITEQHEPLYFCCLEDWSEDMKDAGGHKEAWYNIFKNRGLGVKLPLDDKERVGGMIQYLPIEHSYIAGTVLLKNCPVFVPQKMETLKNSL